MADPASAGVVADSATELVDAVARAQKRHSRAKRGWKKARAAVPRARHDELSEIAVQYGGFWRSDPFLEGGGVAFQLHTFPGRLCSDGAPTIDALVVCLRADFCLLSERVNFILCPVAICRIDVVRLGALELDGGSAATPRPANWEASTRYLNNAAAARDEAGRMGVHALDRDRLKMTMHKDRHRQVNNAALPLLLIAPAQTAGLIADAGLSGGTWARSIDETGGAWVLVRRGC